MIAEKPNRITRHGPPNEYDQAEIGTECYVITDKGFDLYIQKSSDEEIPDWFLVGSVEEIS